MDTITIQGRTLTVLSAIPKKCSTCNGRMGRDYAGDTAELAMYSCSHPAGPCEQVMVKF